MSTLMEDRLAAALRARAEQVQPEDLSPFAVPVVSLEERRAHAGRRRRTAVLAGLAAAACAAAVAPLLLTGTGPDGTPRPAAPTGSAQPRPTSSTERPAAGALTVDVDGDGVKDTAWLDERDSGPGLVVDLGSGERVVPPVLAGEPGPLLPVGDLGGGPGDELVVPVSSTASDLPVVYTWLGREGLVVASWPDVGLENWRPGNPQNRWTVRENGLRTWEAESIPGDDRYPYWDWSVDDEARLLPGPVRLGCAAPDDAPAPCRGEDETGKASPAVGPRGDLPELMPAVTEVLRHQPYRYGTGPAADDYAQLQGDFGAEAGAVADGQVELVVTALGEEHRASIPAGQSPRLVPQPLGLWGDAPAFLVQRSGGDTAVVELYSFWNGELGELEPETDVFLGSGFVDHRGEMAEQRTWITPEGRMFTAVLLDWGTGRHHLWQWDPNAGETITTIDLGEVCIDWETGEYGRCR